MKNPVDDLGIFSLRDFNSLSNLFASGAIKVAIVGNGGINHKDKEKIEQANIVVRFNNFANRNNEGPNSSRCDVLFTTFDLFCNCNPRVVVAGIPFPFKPERIYQKFKEHYSDCVSRMVNPYLCMEMCRELEIPSLGFQHPFPSIGFTALWHIHRQLKFKLPGSFKFYVCGFEWYFDKETNLFQKFHLSNTNYPTHWNHNYPKELRWILLNLKDNPNFIFGPRQKELFKIAEEQINSSKSYGQSN